MRLFVYGTLTDPDRAGAILDDFAFVGPAILEGCHRVDGAYPTLAPGGRVRGRLLETTEMEALDAYEGVGNGLYVRVEVPLRSEDQCQDEAKPDTAAVYVGDPEALSVVEDVSWPGDGPFAERVRKYVHKHAVVVCQPSDADSTS